MFKYRIPSIICFLSAMFCMVAGLFVLIKTQAVASMLDYQFTSWGGKTEFMTFYGGFYIGIGIFLMTSGFIISYSEAALLLLALSSIAALITRTIAILGNQVDRIFYQLLIGEGILCLMGLVGWTLIRLQTGYRA